MEEGDFALSVFSVIEFHKFWVNSEVGNANLCKEFIDFSCSCIRFKWGSHCRMLKDVEEEVVFRKRRISEQINRQ